MKNFTNLKMTIFLSFFILFSASTIVAQAFQVGAAKDYDFNQTIPEPTKAEFEKYMPSEIQGEDEYIIFNNLIAYEGTSFIYDNAYGKYIKRSGQFSDGFKELPFADATFQQYDVTDYDCVLFPMGGYHLLSATSGGTTIISVINDLLDAGKRVIIWSHMSLYEHFSGRATSPEVKTFLENKMGIEYISRMSEGISTRVGGNSTWYPYIVYGRDSDWIGLNQSKSCNAIGISNTGQEIPSLVNYYDIDIFRTKNDEQWRAFDYYDHKGSDTVLGIRTTFPNKAKCIFWSFGFENMHFNTVIEPELNAAIAWSLMTKADAGAELSLMTGQTLDMGYVTVGESKTKSIIIMNTGIEDLEIRKFTIDPIWTDPGVWVVVDEAEIDLPIVIPPNEMYKMNIKFTPPGDEAWGYPNHIEFETNVLNDMALYEKYNVNFEGYGGEQQIELPYISTVSTLDFGENEIPNSVDLNLDVTNDGNKPLNIESFIMVSEDEAFLIRSGQHNVSLDGGETHTLVVRYIPTVKDVESTGSIEIRSNASNGALFSVKLKGTAVGGEIEGAHISAVSSLDFGENEIPNPVELNLDVANDGNKTLDIESFIMVSEDEAFLIKSGQHNVSLKAGNSHRLVVQYIPTVEDLESTGTIEIKSNATNGASILITLTGTAIGGGSVGEAISKDGKIRMTCHPNPVINNSTLKFEFNGEVAEIVQVYLIDISGQKVKTIANQLMSKGDYDFQVNAAELPSGTYFLHTRLGQTVTQLPIIIAK